VSYAVMGVVSARDELYMERALELAREAAAWGEVPVGAVVVHRDTNRRRGV